MRRVRFTGAVVVLAILTGLTLWRVRALPPPLAAGGALDVPGDVRVAYHVHTSRSDGTGSVDEVAAAAAAAGLDVVILTDHGDGMRVPDPPRRVHGVLVIDAVEISTWAGHYVALGARPSEYPLGGEPAAVVADVARLGGVGLVAHPASAKDDLKWRDWDAAFDGLEWLNADSEWRDRPRRLWEALVTYPWAPSRTIAALLDRPRVELEAWDREAAQRPVVGLAAHDAHARIGLRGVGEPYDGAVALRAPGYASMFRAFSNVVRVGRDGWGGDAASDGAAVIRAVRAGRAYAVITAWGAGRVQTFEATSGGLSVTMGGHLAPVEPVTIVAETTAPASATTTLVCDGHTVAATSGARLTWTTAGVPGACRLEVALPTAGDRAPWITTNPIYLRRELARPPARVVAEPLVVVPMAGSGQAASWVEETAPGSSVDILPVPGHERRLRMQWRLGGTAGAFAAARVDTPADLAAFDRLIVRASADRPMRVWIQLRMPRDGGIRWGTSVYLDETPRQVTLPFAGFLPLDLGAGLRVTPAEVTALLVVADSAHARPGDSGAVTLDELWLAR